MTSPHKTRIDSRGRLAIPGAVRGAANLPAGTEVVVRSGGPGVIIIESIDVIKARILDAAPPKPDDQ